MYEIQVTLLAQHKGSLLTFCALQNFFRDASFMAPNLQKVQTSSSLLSFAQLKQVLFSGRKQWRNLTSAELFYWSYLKVTISHRRSVRELVFLLPFSSQTFVIFPVWSDWAVVLHIFSTFKSLWYNESIFYIKVSIKRYLQEYTSWLCISF